MADKIQYINMEPSDDNIDFGRNVKFKVKLNVKKSILVYLFVEPDKSNKDLSKLKRSDRPGINSVGLAKTSMMTEENGELEFELCLSNYGGDKFTVKAALDKSGTKGKKLSSTNYEVWKKLYYQTSKMKPSFGFPFNMVVDEYKKHNIELEETSTVNIPHKENLETAELEAYKTHFKKAKTPYEAHIVLIDRQCDSNTINLNGRLTKQETFLEQNNDDWPFSDWLIKADATDQNGKAGAASIVRKTVGGKKGIEISLSGTGLDAVKNNVSINASYKTLKGEYTGDATFKPNVFIAVGSPRSDASKSKTVAHEIGHGVGMVPTSGHDLQYSNENGGSGSHCRHEASPDKKSKAQGGTFSGTYTNGKCVMFAYSSEHYKFCNTCKEFVKESDLSEDAMKARDWG